MNKNKIGYNFQREAIGGRYEDAVNLVKESRPTTVTVIDGFDLADDFLRVSPETIVIHRDYKIGDDQNLWKNISPGEMVDRYRNRHTNRDVWVYLLNEPLVDPSRIPDFVNWLVKTTDGLVESGFKVCVGNLAIAAHRVEDIDDGLYDDLLKMLDRQRGNAVLGIHEYTAHIIPLGTGHFSPEDLVHEGKIQMIHWPRTYSIAKRDTEENRSYPPFWHTLRGQWFNIRAQEIGIEPINMIVTESPIDRMGDIARHERRFHHQGRFMNVYDHLTEMYGVPAEFQMAGLKGPMSYEYVWSKQFNMHYEDFFFEQCKYLIDIYPSSVLGVNLFAWSYNYDWNGYGFNIGRMPRFLQNVIEYSKGLEGGDSDDTIEVPVPEDPDNGDDGEENGEQDHELLSIDISFETNDPDRLKQILEKSEIKVNIT